MQVQADGRRNGIRRTLRALHLLRCDGAERGEVHARHCVIRRDSVSRRETRSSGDLVVMMLPWLARDRYCLNRR